MLLYSEYNKVVGGSPKNGFSFQILFDSLLQRKDYAGKDFEILGLILSIIISLLYDENKVLKNIEKRLNSIISLFVPLKIDFI
jgi:hypothetical protein